MNAMLLRKIEELTLYIIKNQKQLKKIEWESMVCEIMKKQIALVCLFIGIIYAQVPTNGLIGYWPFSGNSKDKSGREKHIRIEGAELTTDRFGNLNSAYQFDGDWDFGQIPRDIFVHANTYSISLWLNPATANKDEYFILDFNGILSDLSFFYRAHTASNYKNSVLVSVNNGYVVAPENSVPYDQWTHILVTYDGIASTLYINGVNSGNVNHTPPQLRSAQGTFPYYSSAGLATGQYQDRMFFPGVIDDVRIYDRALNTTEISQLFTENPGTPIYHSISLSGNGGGTIYPEGLLQVINGEGMDLTLTSDRGYKVKDLTIDGTSIGSSNQYELDGITSSASILAEFEPIDPVDVQIDDGLIGYWPLDGNGNDLSGNNINGEVVNGTPEVDRFGSANGCLSFSNGYVGLGNNPLLKQSLPMTLSAWITPSVYAIFDNDVVSSTFSGLSVCKIGARIFTYLGDGNGGVNASIIPQYSNVEWIHLVVVINSIDDYKYFINGKFVEYLDDIPPIPNIQYLGGQAYIGKNNWYTTNGKIDDVRLYNRALTEPEIVELAYYNALAPKYTINTSAGVGGTITPLGDTEIEEMGDLDVVITADSGYRLKDLIVNSQSVTKVDTFKIRSIDKNYIISAEFELIPPTYTISVSSGNGGTINPSNDIVLEEGQSQTFEITPAAGYRIDDVIVNSVSFGEPSQYTIASIDENKTIEAVFKKTYIITASASPGGTISPDQESVVDSAANKMYTFTPDIGYKVKDVLVNGESVGAVYDYTITGVTHNTTINVEFEVGNRYYINVVGGTGLITPDGTWYVNQGDDVSFTFESFTSDGSREIAYIVLNDQLIVPNDPHNATYILSNIDKNYDITMAFKTIDQTKHYINSNADWHYGAMSPEGQDLYDEGSSVTYTFTPKAGYRIKDVKVDNISQGPITTYTFNSINTSHYIYPTFEEIVGDTCTITANATVGGSVSPVGSVKVPTGGSQNIVIIPNSGYRIKNVIVDGKELGNINEYTFNNIQQNSILMAEFELIPTSVNILAFAELGGVISPSGDIEVNFNENKTFIITPDYNHNIKSITVDDQNIGKDTIYTFTNLQYDHTINAEFQTAYHIIAETTSGGIINSSGDIKLDSNATKNFHLTASEGYFLHFLEVDGENLGASFDYTFNSISESHTIKGHFLSNNYLINTPLGVSADTALTEQIDLSWPISLNATHYSLYRADVNNENYVLIADSINQNNYSDFGLQFATEYKYRIKAFNLFYETDFSEPVIIKTRNYVEVISVSAVRGVDDWLDKLRVVYRADMNGFLQLYCGGSQIWNNPIIEATLDTVDVWCQDYTSGIKEIKAVISDKYDGPIVYCKDSSNFDIQYMEPIIIEDNICYTNENLVGFYFYISQPGELKVYINDELMKNSNDQNNQSFAFGLSAPAENCTVRIEVENSNGKSVFEKELTSLSYKKVRVDDMKIVDADTTIYNSDCFTFYYSVSDNIEGKIELFVDDSLKQRWENYESSNERSISQDCWGFYNSGTHTLKIKYTDGIGNEFVDQKDFNFVWPTPSARLEEYYSNPKTLICRLSQTMDLTVTQDGDIILSEENKKFGGHYLTLNNFTGDQTVVNITGSNENGNSSETKIVNLDGTFNESTINIISFESKPADQVSSTDYISLSYYLAEECSVKVFINNILIHETSVETGPAMHNLIYTDHSEETNFDLRIEALNNENQQFISEKSFMIEWFSKEIENITIAPVSSEDNSTADKLKMDFTIAQPCTLTVIVDSQVVYNEMISEITTSSIELVTPDFTSGEKEVVVELTDTEGILIFSQTEQITITWPAPQIRINRVTGITSTSAEMEYYVSQPADVEIKLNGGIIATVPSGAGNNTYLLNNLTEDINPIIISATNSNTVVPVSDTLDYGMDYYTITLPLLEYGCIEFEGQVVTGSFSISEFEKKTIFIVPNAGYMVQDVKTNGESKGGIYEFTFENITENQTVEVSLIQPQSYWEKGINRLATQDRVFIGTNQITSDYNLSVYGKIKTLDIYISPEWPDFVFENNYSLMNLEEVLGYIKANGHLPGIPSQSEVMNDGIEVCEMTAMLLRKIEELTLYILTNQKITNYNNKEINSLKAN